MKVTLSVAVSGRTYQSANCDSLDQAVRNVKTALGTQEAKLRNELGEASSTLDALDEWLGN